jgi:phosphoribosylpyrophosphate synthetase
MEVESTGGSGRSPDGIVLWATKIPNQSPAERFLEMAIGVAALGDAFPGCPITLAHAYYDGSRSHLLPAGLALARLMDSLPIARQLIFDLHDEAILQKFKVPTIHRPSWPIWADHVRSHRPRVDLIVSPDRGRQKTVEALGRCLAMETICLDKKNPDFSDFCPSLAGRHAFVYDDEIVTGNTLDGTIRQLNRRGIGSLALGASYPLCSPGTLAFLRGREGVTSLALGDFIHFSPPIAGPISVLPLAHPLLQMALKRRNGETLF